MTGLPQRLANLVHITGPYVMFSDLAAFAPDEADAVALALVRYAAELRRTARPTTETP